MLPTNTFPSLIIHNHLYQLYKLSGIQFKTCDNKQWQMVPLWRKNKKWCHYGGIFKKRHQIS